MKGRNTLFGIVLILIGMVLYFRNFHIVPVSTLLLFAGLFLLYLYNTKKEQPFLIFGGIFTFIGALSVLKDLSEYRFNISFEIFLIIVGIIFLFFFYYKKIVGFIYPGTFLPAFGLYFLMMRFMDERYMWPGIFILLGLAFYFIYFTVYMGGGYARQRSWPLIPGTILIVLGAFFFAMSFGFLSVDLLKYIDVAQYKNYIWSVLLILLGVLMLYSSLRGKRA